MTVMSITVDRVPEAAAALSRAMLDEPGGRWLLPDEHEFIDVHEQIYLATMRQAMDVGRVDGWGDPFVAVALWLERPPIDAAPRSAPSDGSGGPVFPPHAAARIEEAERLIRLMRKRARPDHHIYLDSIGVLPAHRRQGIATRLLDVGFAWADAKGLPISLDTLDDGNVAFYQRRGFEIVAIERIADSDLIVTAMRRPSGAATS